jgi:hypothetical protein
MIVDYYYALLVSKGLGHYGEVTLATGSSPSMQGVDTVLGEVFAVPRTLAMPLFSDGTQSPL